jgi:uncharacterized FAD-dependent dehydrogenase
MNQIYDVVIIGGGISGLMCAYQLVQTNVNLKICTLEKGKPLDQRKCVADNKTSCKQCNPCSIMNGMAGAGAFSDGKYIISTEYGGWLQDYIGDEKTLEYINKVNNILINFGATKEVYKPDNELKQRCLMYDLHMQQADVKHLGTDENYTTMLNLINYLESKIDIKTNFEVDMIEKHDNLFCIIGNTFQSINTKKIVIAVGRSGNDFVEKFCKENKIPLLNNQVDIGVRVELPQIVWDEFEKKIYEPKIWYRTKQYGDIVRMFCFCGSGSVTAENTNGVVTVNGHSKRNIKTDNSNFALLSSINFTQPFDRPIEYAKYIASLANMVSGGSVLVQRFGDLIGGRRTTEKRLEQSSVNPTLKAVPGDLSLVIPKRQLDNIIEMLYSLDKLVPGTANHDTLLYGIEAKYYSAKPKMNEFQIMDNVYVCGDGSGITRSLSQAAANGLCIGDLILGGL